ncbi:NfeD family protein [Pectinatus cerevisiiphilus]|uniref:NfeD-like partner-binding protein n=1 Tax=Pectinatus cerevisiiphilus TaxID=86956 RepID=A0A4R3K4S5_9FIRM|nr:NfeD family protein [Pectinatus cerevisiiphilus]TCS77808.1 NfeD-like partner-binding protein [Pectinatus cerevisiiphilus]
MDIIVDLPALKMLLIAIIFLSVLIEIKTGGTGLGAFLGIIAAAVFWGSGYIKGLVNIYHIALFLGGILFIIIELVTPATGIFAALGIVMMLYSIILGLGGNIDAVYMLIGALVIAIVLFAFIVKKLPSSRLWQKVILKDSSTEDRGYTSSTDNSSLLHKEGTVLTELRPAGTILIDGSPIDAISEGAYIDKGKKIRIIKIEGNRIIVREV